MQITKDWIEVLSKRYGVSKKIIMDTAFPKAKTRKNRSLAYFDRSANISVLRIEALADLMGCSMDEIMRRPYTPPSSITGDNNMVGNVSINSDVESLRTIIKSQNKIITHQDAEIARLQENLKEQLRAKDKEIDAKNKQIDRLISYQKHGDNQ